MTEISEDEPLKDELIDVKHLLKRWRLRYNNATLTYDSSKKRI